MCSEGGSALGDDMTLEPPKPSTADAVHQLVKAALSAVPIVGGPAAELLAALIAPPIERRRQEWMESIGRGLADLRSRDLVALEALADNQVFLDTVLQASQVAIRTADVDKRAALRNAVLNAALPNPPEESLQTMFLSLIDQFTPWHLRILKLFQDPASWAAKDGARMGSVHMAGVVNVLERSFPELVNRRTFYDQVWADLYQRGLVNTNSLHTKMTREGLADQRTTDLGNQFLRFIEEPFAPQGDGQPLADADPVGPDID
jgi:hypothetical protein